jgi:hypothetical protein
MQNNILEKLTIEFYNTKPVEVIDFLTSINAFRKEYETTVKAEGLKLGDDDMKLYIKVKEGSLIWELLILKPLQTTLDFVGNKILYKTWDSFNQIFSKVKKEESTSHIPAETLNNAKEFLQPISNDLASKVKVLYEDNSKKLNIEGEFYGTDGRAVFSKLEELISHKKLPLADEFEDKVLQLSISNRQNATAIRGVIGDFGQEDYQIIFSNNIKDEITRQEKPFEVYYLVNGSVKRSPSNNKIVAYHITKIEKIEV